MRRRILMLSAIYLHVGLAIVCMASSAVICHFSKMIRFEPGFWACFLFIYAPLLYITSRYIREDMGI